MLHQTTQYALRALAALAGEPEGWQDVRAIARQTGTATNYLSKVLGQLVRLGVVDSRRGKGGGFRLRRSSAKTSIEVVVRAFEGAAGLRRCVFGLAECSDDAPCPLHDHWKKVEEARTRMLQRTTIADLVVPKGKCPARSRRGAARRNQLR